MSYLASILHDIKSNTLEVSWLEEVLDDNGEPIELRSVKRRNYSQDQKADFLADCGDNGQKYVTLAGW